MRRGLHEGGHYLRPRRSDDELLRLGAPHILRIIQTTNNAKHRDNLRKLARKTA